MKGGGCNPLTPPLGAAFACSKILTKSKSFSSISDSDLRRFKIMTRDMGPPPLWQGLYSTLKLVKQNS